MILDLTCDNRLVRISAKADYAVRAALEMAAAPEGEPVKGERLAEAQDIPLQFLEHILLELKHARLVQARRGAKGGYWLARPPTEITVADVIRAVEGPLANIHENAPEDLHYGGPAEKLRDVWVAVRAGLRSVLENVTLADVAQKNLPWRIDAILNNPEAWMKR
jgi:Rrf2 family protein